MSPDRSRIVSTVVDSLPFGDSEQFLCEFCGLEYETERPNCPACGGPIVLE
jgi:predicted amidophosphoribosyltransferase